MDEFNPIIASYVISEKEMQKALDRKRREKRKLKIMEKLLTLGKIVTTAGWITIPSRKK